MHTFTRMHTPHMPPVLMSIFQVSLGSLVHPWSWGLVDRLLENFCVCRSLLWPVWCNSRARAFTHDPKGRSWVWILAIPLPGNSLVTKQYDMVPPYGRWRSSDGKITAGLVESNSSLLPGWWLEVTCRLTACTPGLAPAQCLETSMGKLCIFMLSYPDSDHGITDWTTSIRHPLSDSEGTEATEKFISQKLVLQELKLGSLIRKDTSYT